MLDRLKLNIQPSSEDKNYTVTILELQNNINLISDTLISR